MSTQATALDRDLTQVIETNLPLVQHVVYQVAVHFPRHVDREELARAGAVGLIEAARRYDGRRGVPFERFAAQRIRGAILDAVRAADWAPRSLRKAARTVETTRQELANGTGRQPTTDELAVALDMPVEKLRELQDRVHRSVVLALDDRVASEDDDDLCLADVLTDRTMSEPSEQLETRELHAYLRDAVGLLPDRHRQVIVGYFFEGWTSQELAEHLEVTESRISQLRSEAFEMMRDGISAQFPEVAAGATPVVEAEPRGRVARRQAAYASAIAERSTWQARLERVQLVDQERVGQLV